MPLTPQQIQDLEATFARDGYVVIPQVVSRPQLQQHNRALLDEFARAKRAGELFSGGGMVSGHLNCFPGEQARFVYQALDESGVLELVKRLSPGPLRMPNVGCNLNLPGSTAQNIHVDGYASQAFMIVNVAPLDTDVVNGAIELSPGTHVRDYKYHEFVLARRASTRVPMKTGDALVRTSSLWHRGMPNRSKAIRPMLGFTWEEGGSELADPFMRYEGKIRFFPNRYTPDFKGMLRERAFAALPVLGSSYRFVRSILER
ncbi:MAG TPA: phytanoyl-CoA dioxygenase family protein [Polyangiales bacterium]